MYKKRVKRNLVLGILFFLPVAFLLMLLPATHNYEALDIVKDEVPDLSNFSSLDQNVQIRLKDHITVLGIIGSDPQAQSISISNVKELIYDKFRGFKKFQVVLLATPDSKEKVNELISEISPFEPLEYFHVVYGSAGAIKGFFKGIKTENVLNDSNASTDVIIIDKELHQRGRLIDEGKKNEKGNPLWSYNTLEVAEMKNKLSEDMRILLTEYRQKRKGEFNSTIRRAEDLSNYEQEN
ncbi:hypothetical protein [Aegicerativicinus sediminis]